MCGRYTLAIAYEELAEELGVALDPTIAEAYQPHYNIPPTSANLVLREHEGERELMGARFGLVNFWAKDLSGAARQINARAETVRSKPAFREAFEKRRCVVPADGFYEWRLEAGQKKKTAYWFHPSDSKLFRFAGVYETWKDKETGERLRTFAIITTAANDVMEPYHDRMPAILKPADVDAWLTGSADDAFKLLRPASNRMVEVQRASPRVGNVRNDDPGLIRDEGAAPADEALFARSK